MARRKNQFNRAEPAHSLLYSPSQLPLQLNDVNTHSLLEVVNGLLAKPFNVRQSEAFNRTFSNRLTLLWGPPGTGKTSVLAGVVVGWLERAVRMNESLCVGIGSSNYDAIDNVLIRVVELILAWKKNHNSVPTSIRVVRIRSQAEPALEHEEIEEFVADEATELAQEMEKGVGLLIVGGTWRQLGKMAESMHTNPAAKWFDLLMIDEASQLRVAHAAAYFLLLRENANVILAGDDRQLGPIFGFEMKDSQQGLFDCIFTYLREAHQIEPVSLNQNYRTNLEVSGWPRVRFYHQDYEAFNPTRRLEIKLPTLKDEPPYPDWPSELPWSKELLQILNPDLPVAVVTYDAQTYTLSNPMESQWVASLTYLYWRILQNEDNGPDVSLFWRDYLGIVTPHRAQMSNIRNLLLEKAGMPSDVPPAVSTVDSFQGQERNLIIASYAVADKDFIKAEDKFILNPRRFNVTLTRARSKFIMFISNALVQHLSSDSQVAEDASHLQLFVFDYCSNINQEIELPFFEEGKIVIKKCRLHGRK